MQRTLRITILSVFALLCFGSSTQSTVTSSTADEVSNLLQKYDGQIMPDVMGNVNVLEISDGMPVQHTAQVDEFTLYPGWPIFASGGSFEGGIFYNMDADSALEIIYTTAYAIHVWNLDGTEVLGWPQTISHPAQGAPALGDIDNDEVRLSTRL